MKESIKILLQSGCSIKFPYKESIDSWYGDVSISKLRSRKSDVYVIQPAFTEIHDIDDAIDYFINIAFSPKNIGYIQSRLKEKGVEFDDYDLENPTADVKEKFKEEAILVKEEFKKFNIKIKKLSKEKASKEFEEISKKFDNFSEFETSIKSFIKEYSRLDLYMPVNFFYKLNNGKETCIGTSIDELTEGRIKGSKDLTIFSNNNTIEKLLRIEI
jgi:hypothetical protein